ncbi:methyltransferase domain-containing protein, partial [Candidatus Saccharibacteria bacterium]|nr:methyltransferase domain-containing protein [Candidatus Saccharibacteria bacterium]
MPVILSQSQIRSFYKDTIYNNLPNEEKLDAPIDSRIKDLINQIVELGGKNAIDLGYGYGNHSMILARKGMNVTAIDYIPAEIFQQKVDTFGLTNKIRIISKDIGQLKVNEAFNFVIGKDVLHFLSKQKVKSLMTSLVEMSPSYSIHYYEIFADIV